jgi:hypothetical protein
VGASSAVPGSGGDISALSRSGQVAVVGGVSVGVVRLLPSVLAASDGRSAGPSAAMERPSRPAVMRYGRSSWMHMYRTVGSPSRVTRLRLVTVTPWTSSVQLTCTPRAGPCARSVRSSA